MFFKKTNKNGKQNWHDYTKDVLIKYLETKYYDKKFLPIALYPDTSLIDFRAYPEGGDKERDMVTVYVKEDKDGTIILKDDYFFEYIRKEYDDCVTKLAGEVFKNFKIFYTREMYHDDQELKIGDTLEYIQKNDIDFSVSIKILTDDDFTSEEFNEKFVELIRKMHQKNLNGTVIVYHIYKGNMDSLNELNYDKFVSVSGQKWTERIIEDKHKLISNPDLWRKK